LQALLRAEARLQVGEILVGDGDRAPPEMSRCANRNWTWDGVSFSLQDVDGSCWISARTPTRTFLAAAGRKSSSASIATADVLLLPRAAREAAALLPAVTSRDGIALASITGREWRSQAWRELLERRPDDWRVFATAGEGALRVVLQPGGRVRTQRLSRATSGIWTEEQTGSQCRQAPQAQL